MVDIIPAANTQYPSDDGMTLLIDSGFCFKVSVVMVLPVVAVDVLVVAAIGLLCFNKNRAAKKKEALDARNVHMTEMA
jgi:hypothetical protein